MTDKEDAQMLLRTYKIMAKEQGMKEGFEQGVEKGIEQKTKESAISLYKNDISKELIVTSLKISLEKLDEYLN